MNLGSNELTYCGHATFALRTQSGKHWIIDPFLEQNPLCPGPLKNPAAVDTLLITHGHMDHIADAVRLARKHDATCVCIVETGSWLTKKGVKNLIAFNKGGTVDVDGVKVTMTHAVHSCGIQDGDEMVYGGEAAGYVIRLANGLRIYHAGDTCVFGDMKLIGELYKPDIACLPIGNYYTMDPLEAAYAIRLLGVKTVIPMHYGTFPVLTGTPQALRAATADIAGLEIIELKPGEVLSGELKRAVSV